jgi:N-acetylglutamate synthase-like GNAT family acetyltransferase
LKILEQHQTKNGIFFTAIPETETEFENYYDVRWQVLRKPLNKPKGSERDANEEEKFHFVLLNDQNEIIGTCCLQLNSAEEAQVRYMAVNALFRGKQLGDFLMHVAEAKAKSLNTKHVFLQARENAVHFYKRNGYEIIEKTFILHDVIQHYSMKKNL